MRHKEGFEGGRPRGRRWFHERDADVLLVAPQAMKWRWILRTLSPSRSHGKRYPHVAQVDHNGREVRRLLFPSAPKELYIVLR